MERYIKILCIASIIAILSFLGLQAYWLYSRYEFSVREIENSLIPIASESLDEYNFKRDTYKPDSSFQYLSSYHLSKETDDDCNTKRAIKVSARRFNPWQLLGLSSPRNLTQEEYVVATRIAMRNREDVDSLIISADATDAPSEAAMWSAAQTAALEFKSPLTIAGIDSTLKVNGINAEISITKADTMVWKPSLIPHTSLLKPTATVVIPYSILEKKNLKLVCQIPAMEILSTMLWTLVIAGVVSVLLIVCLIWQFKIIFRLNRLDKMRNSFITTMIHELKRPVSTLKMCVSGLRNKNMVGNAEIREELIGDTKDAIDILSAYFSKMRDIAFNDSTRIPLSCVKIGLRQLVDESAKRISVPSGKVVEYNNRVEPSMELYADSSHIANVFLNLFENDVKYSGESVTIEVDSRKEENGSVTIIVKDNGNGIAQSDLGKVFSRFYRGEASRTDVPGMGLGLTYVKLLVEAHGGTISVESHTEGTDKGTYFTINLPQ